jgi:iron complex outermembrane recepter protein
MNRLGFKSQIALLGTAAAVVITIGSAANAQVQEQQAPPQEDQSATDQDSAEIIITAQKREERILDIPQSVTVVGGDTLERQHATSFSDYLSQVPGLSLEQSEPGVGRLVLRGVNTGGVSSTVAVYVDETPFGSSTGLVNGAILAGDFDTFDIARIEVLRGPQGTLYGASSLGGVLKFVTNTPQLGTFSARGRVGLEFVDGGGTGYNSSAAVNVPFGDMAAFRGSGFYRKNAGWVDASGSTLTLLNPLPAVPPFPVPAVSPIDIPSLGGKNINQGQVWGGRGSLLFKPTQELSIRLTAIAQHIESDAPSSVEVDQDNYNPFDGKLQQTVVFRQPNTLKYRLYNGTIEYDLGFANLLSSTSYGTSDQAFKVDLAGAYGTLVNLFYGQFHPGFSIDPAMPDAPLTSAVIGPYQNQQTDLNKFTQELRLASPSNDTFEWMLGAYYTHEKGVIDQFIGSVDMATRQPFGDPTLDDLADARLVSKYKELAGFANVTWHATERFDVTAGARLAKNDQSAHQVTSGPLAGVSDDVTKSEESVFTYSLSPRYEINDNTAVYARVAKGYRPGGPNVLPPTAPPSVPRTFGSDSITSYEVGLKSDVGRRVSLDIAAYHLKWKDIQLFSFIDNFGVNINGATAVSNGVEGSLLLRPMPGLQLGLNGAWIDAHLTKDTPAVVGGKDGDRLPYIPKLSFSLNTDYEWKIGNATTAFVGGTLAYTGSQRDNFDALTFVPGFPAVPQARIPGYATIDLRGGVEFDRFTVEAYVKNLTNSEGVSSLGIIEDAVTHANQVPNGGYLAALTRPRTIGISLSAGF